MVSYRVPAASVCSVCEPAQRDSSVTSVERREGPGRIAMAVGLLIPAQTKTRDESG